MSEINYSKDLIDLACDGDELLAYWIDLHYEILFAKAVYYKLVSYGFEPMNDNDYDDMEQEYKEVSKELNRKPTACDLVGWEDNATLEALAMKNYDENLYNQLKDSIFEFH